MSLFTSRSTAIEIMDDLQCSGEVVNQTLRELEIINRLLGGNHVTINGVRQLLKNRKTTYPITIADLGCGGGDILKLVAAWGRKNKIPLQLTGIDANSNIIDYAVKYSGDYPEINYTAVNIFSSEFTQQSHDIVLATLFTHHFTSEELIHLLRQLKSHTHTGIVINDLHRHWLAYYSIKWLTQLFSKSAMVKTDAPLSVLRGFKKQELTGILKQAGIENYTLRWRWAFRWELIINTTP
ncbi:MAG: SAM-dependent methyltransferase [Azospira oryzae]|jgi:2-polyprenyl-3-methyl-5-hydroxy-6-metoxy-1,4-benzoquinol methylase|nr:SAM-dependent methyltransferase [Cytophaga sp.]PZR37280.1 MAG: SAM-dependent methyltransferase [Azospira oryzae]